MSPACEIDLAATGIRHWRTTWSEMRRSSTRRQEKSKSCSSVRASAPATLHEQRRRADEEQRVERRIDDLVQPQDHLDDGHETDDQHLAALRSDSGLRIG